MTTPNKILALALLLAATFLVGWCSFRDKDNPAPVTPARSEAERVKADTENQVAQAKFSADSTVEKMFSKALDERLSKLTAQHKVDVEKAVQSALKYAKNQTPENCHHALQDCQHENQSKAAVIGTQTEKIGSLKRIAVRDSSELGRYRMENHLLNTNLKDVNQRWQADLDKASKGRYHLYGAIQAGTDGKALKSVTPAAVLTTPKGWLGTYGYEVLRGEHTVGIGREIRFGR